jgi:hypothetical protein
VHVASLEISVDAMEMLKALPPATWCMCGEGAWPGLTSGSMRSMTVSAHPKRSMVKPWEPPNWGAAEARAVKRRGVRSIVAVLTTIQAKEEGM